MSGLGKLRLNNFMLFLVFLNLVSTIYGVTILGNTASCITIYGIMQCLQTIYCRFGEFYVENHGKILVVKMA